MDSNESTEDLIRKVIYFILNYELENNEPFPNRSWCTVNLVNGYYIKNPRDIFYDWVDIHPKFFTWVSVLANRRIDLWSLCQTIQLLDANTLRELNEQISYVREAINEYDRYRNRSDFDESDRETYNALYHQNLFALEILENKKQELSRSMEEMINKIIPQHGPARLIGSMMGLDEYKHESGSIEEKDIEEQLLKYIPELVDRGIRYDAFRTDWHANELYQYIQHRPQILSLVHLAFEREEHKHLSELFLYISQTYQNSREFVNNAPFDNTFENLYRRVAHLPNIDNSIANHFRIECANKVCSLCVDEISSGQMVMNLVPCKHCFHYECALSWFTRQRENNNRETCPQCTAEVLNIKISHIVSFS